MSPKLKEMITENNASAMRQFYNMASDPVKMLLIINALDYYRHSLNYDDGDMGTLFNIEKTFRQSFLPLTGQNAPSTRPWGSHEFDYDCHLARYGHFD